jgi:hypothetical protein
MATDIGYTDLSDEDIEALNLRSEKGVYARDLQAFVESGARGRRFDVAARGIKKASLNTGFKSAVTKAGLEGQVRVVQGEDFVALVNTGSAE